MPGTKSATKARKQSKANKERANEQDHRRHDHGPLAEQMDAATHRALLQALNDAVRADDLVYGKPVLGHAHPEHVHPEHHDHDGGRERMMRPEHAEAIIAWRDRKSPLGFRHWQELFEIEAFKPEWLDDLIFPLSAAVRGQWQDFPVAIPRRGNGTIDGVVHAILLKTGKVLFITADQTTLLWDPENTAASTFEDPDNQPHLMPGGYSQICGHHVQLSDAAGSIMSVGGGGYGPNALAKAAYIFNPETQEWHRSANDMVSDKWYPTAVSLGGKKILVASGKTWDGDMELFDEDSETFQPISGDDKVFPNLYPGLHLLPNGAIFYSRTGFGTAGAGPGGTAYDDPAASPDNLGGKRSAYFSFNPAMTGGTWQKITPSPVNRVKGFSVTLLKSTPPYVRVMVMGGVDDLTNDTYEMFDASVLSPTAGWGPAQGVPDGENRTLCSGVLLPDGKLFVCGGIQSANSPCTRFDPETDSWAAMAELPSIRDYHSVALLLPSGKVMMAGWYNDKIEIFSPPYLFQGPRPEITDAPDMVHHGADFTIESPQAAELVKVTLVRPMAVTHQTDSEQRVIELLPFIHDHVNPDRIKLRAPNGDHPHPMAPRGHYMMFAINNVGVPSVARWIYLH